MAHTIVRSVSRIVYIQRTTTTATKVESYVSIFLFLDIDVRVWRVPQFVDFSSLTSYIFIFSLSISRRWICVPSSNDCVRSIHLLWATYSKNSTTPSYSFRKTEKKHTTTTTRERRKKKPQKKKKETFCLTYSEGMLVCINVYFGGWVSDAHSLRWFSALLGLCAKTAHGHSNRTNTRIIYTKKKQIYKKLVVRCSSRNRSILFVS